MRIINGLVGGLAGAASVTLLHEWLRKKSAGAPRLDKLGQQAAQKAIAFTGHRPPTGKKLYAASLAGDLVSNALYYGWSAASSRHPLRTAALMGLSAGIGAVKLPEKIGLKKDYTAGSTSRKLTTIGLYTVGGLVSGVVVRTLQRMR